MTTALVVLAAGTAGAAPDGAPEPDCHGPGFIDPRGDQVSPGDAPDIVGGWFGYSAGRMTANIRGANIPTKPPQGVRAVSYTFSFRIGDSTYTAGAFMDRDGSVDFTQTRNDYTGPGVGAEPVQRVTTGRTFPGEDGVIQVDLVPDDLLRDGAEATAFGASAWELRDSGAGTGVIAGSDDAYDDTGLTAQVTPCDGASATPPPAATEPPAPSEPAASGGESPGGGATRRLAVAVAPKGTLKRRRVLLRVAATDRVTGLTARLQRGRRVVGRGRLSSVGGLATIRLKVRRGTRPGRYTLRLTGTDADGVRRSLRVSLRLTR